MFGARRAAHLAGHAGQLGGQFDGVVGIPGNRGAAVVLQIVVEAHGHGVGRVAAHGDAVVLHFDFEHVVAGTVADEGEPEAVGHLGHDALGQAAGGSGSLRARGGEGGQRQDEKQQSDSQNSSLHSS